MGAFFHVFNSAVLVIVDLVGFFLRFVAILAAVAFASIAFYYSFGFMNIQMLATGYLLMPVGESESAIGPPAVDAASTIQDLYNDYFVTIANDLIRCVEPLGEIWNRLVNFARGLFRRFGEVFGLNFPQWDQYRRYSDEHTPTMTRREFIVRMAEETAREAGLTGEDGKWHTQARALEARARYLAIRIARTLDPSGERLSLPSFLPVLCSIIRDIFKVLLDIFITLTEFVLTVLDLIIDLLGIAFDDDILTFAQVLVKLMIDIILSILDPCRCFGGFPGNFPRSIFKCICFWEYTSDADVPSNVINALVGCFCPGFNINGDIVDDIIRPCFKIPLLEFLLDLVDTGIEIAMTVIDKIVYVKDKVQDAIDFLHSIIDDLESLVKRRSVFECGENELCYFDITDLDEGRRSQWDLTRYNNVTNEVVSTTTKIFNKRKYHAERLDDPWLASDMGYSDAMAVLRHLQHVHYIKRLNFDASVEANKMYMESLARAYNISQTYEEKPPSDWAREVSRSLPDIPCPLPIDTGARASRVAQGLDRWMERMSHVKNYFLQGIADRMRYAFVRTALDFHNITVNPDFFSEHIRRPERADDVLLFISSFREILRVFSEVMLAPKTPTSDQVYERLGDIPLRETVEALHRTARDIRIYHGREVQDVYDVQIGADVAMTAICDPMSLPRIARRYGKMPENLAGLERSIDALEHQLDNVDEARALHEAGRDQDAVFVLRKKILGDRVMRYVDVLSGPPRTGSTRIFAIGISIAAGGAITVSAGFLIGLAVVAGPLFALLLALLAILGIPLLAVLFQLAVTGIQTLFNGGEPAGFDPVASLIYLIGPVVLDMFTDSPPTPTDLGNLFLDILDLQVDNLEHIFIELIRLVLTLVFPFSRPPEPAWDPVTGASTEGLVTYIRNRIECRENLFCTISAGEEGADSLGECGCFFLFDGNLLSRKGTHDDPCDVTQGEEGLTICYPSYRLGRYIQGITITDGTPINCEDYGYDLGPSLFETRESYTQLLNTWWTNFVATGQLLAGLLAAGEAIPIVGLGAYPIQAACPCFRPVASTVFKLTIYTQLSSIVYPTIADYFLGLTSHSHNLFLIGPIFKWAQPFFESRSLTFDTGYCAAFYSGSFLMTVGVITTAAPPIIFGALFLLPLLFWFIFRVVLWPVNIVLWGAWYSAWIGNEERKKLDLMISMHDKTWNAPFVEWDSADRWSKYFFPP